MAPEISDALSKLREQLRSQLPEKMDAIRTAFQRLSLSNWQPVPAAELHRMLHSLTGSAGTFGMQSISDAARVAETRLATLLKTPLAPDEAAWQELEKELSRLDQLARIRLASTEPVLSIPAMPPRLNHSPLIYLAEDDPAQAEHLRQALEENGYRVRLFATTEEFRAVCNSAETERPDAIVLDMIFPEGDDMGAILLAEFKACHAHCPPVIFASVRNDISARLGALRSGASRYLVKPLDHHHLTGLLDGLTGRQPPQPYKVLMVDDDHLLLEAQAAILRLAGMEVRTLSEPLQILEVLNDFAPDVAVLDVYMPDASGPELAAILRERDEQLHLPILFLSAETDMSQQLQALNLGGDDFLVKPVQAEHLIEIVATRARRARQNSAIRRRLELNLYEREREHLALNEHAIVSIADRAGNINYVNEKFCKISGYSHDELLGKNHRILKSDEHPPEFYWDLWRTISSGHVWHGEICNRCKDGSLYWVESSITPFLDSDGNPYQYVSIRTDITQVKEAQERLAAAQQLAHLGSFEWNPQTGDLQWSNEHYRLWGLEPESVTPSYELFINGVHPDDVQRLESVLQRALQGGENYDIEHRVIWPDGTLHHIYARGNVAFDRAVLAIRMLGTVQDVTERHQAEQRIIAARDEAVRANMAKSDFLSNMSHELRTPMNAILGFGQLLEFDDTLSEENKDSVNEILKAGNHLLELINEVLDMAKVESGRIELSLEPVEVCSLVKECLSLVSTLADKRDIQLYHKGLQGVAVRADRMRLKQVLINLLSNAIKYNRPGGSVHIEVRPPGDALCTEQGRLCIRVTDTGPGIPAARLAELFQPFNRLDAENSGIEGTGIGLTITRRIVEMMGGIVDVKSELGVGSTFWIELPIESMPAGEHDHIASKGVVSQQNIESLQRTVLYIEDNPANLKLVAQILGRRKHIHLLTAHTPELGIELAMTRRPELILLDINMPGMSGYQVLEVFKSEASLQGIPVIAITANVMPKDIERGKAAGFDGYLTKPINVAEFFSVVDLYLANRE